MEKTTRFAEGMKAFTDGVAICPYGNCGPAYREWSNGWDHVSYQHPERRRELLRVRLGLPAA